MNPVIAAVAAIALIGGVAATVPEDTKPKNAVEAAGGNGTYTEDERYVARLVLCDKVVTNGVSPEVLKTFETEHAFKPDGIRRTNELCTAVDLGYQEGFNAGVSAAEASMRKSV